MRKDILLSIIIPMYNQEKYIGRCLESIVHQELFEKTEIIVVDDGSQDRGGEIVNEYIGKYGQGIKLVTQSNRGLGGARNTGVIFAKGDYIWFVDGDDTIVDKSLLRLFNILNTEPEMVLFDLYEVDSTGNKINYVHSYDIQQNICNVSFKECKGILRSIHSASNRVFEREFYNETSLSFPDRLCFEDFDTIPKIISMAKKITYVSEPLYNYFQNEGSILHSNNVEKYKDILTVVQDLKEYFQKANMFDELRDEIEYMIIFHGYLMVMARIIKVNYKERFLYEYRNYILNNYKYYHRNKFIKRLGLKHKISLWCMDKGLFYPIYLVMSLNRK